MQQKKEVKVVTPSRGGGESSVFERRRGEGESCVFERRRRKSVSSKGVGGRSSIEKRRGDTEVSSKRRQGKSMTRRRSEIAPSKGGGYDSSFPKEVWENSGTPKEEEDNTTQEE